METTIKERPITFSPLMARAILDDRKTQTRRVCKAVPTYNHLGTPIMEWGLSGVYKDDDGRWWLDVQTDVDDCYTEELICPYGKPGDRLWVKEEHWRWGYWDRVGKTKTERDKYLFRPISDGLVSAEFEKPVNKGPFAKRDGSIGWVYRHARFMPRSLSRITLEITDVCVELLQEITEADAIAEGLEPTRPLYGDTGGYKHEGNKDAFIQLWEKLNADRGYGWNQNPFVWVINFKRV